VRGVGTVTTTQQTNLSVGSVTTLAPSKTVEPTAIGRGEIVQPTNTVQGIGTVDADRVAGLVVGNTIAIAPVRPASPQAIGRGVIVQPTVALRGVGTVDTGRAATFDVGSGISVAPSRTVTPQAIGRGVFVGPTSDLRGVGTVSTAQSVTVDVASGVDISPSRTATPDAIGRGELIPVANPEVTVNSISPSPGNYSTGQLVTVDVQHDGTNGDSATLTLQRRIDGGSWEDRDNDTAVTGTEVTLSSSTSQQSSEITVEMRVELFYDSNFYFSATYTYTIDGSGFG